MQVVDGDDAGKEVVEIPMLEVLETTEASVRVPSATML